MTIEKLVSIAKSETVVKNNLLTNYNGDKLIVEAIIPLQGTQPAFNDSSIVYFGLNHESRSTTQNQLSQANQNLEYAV